jgi:hypothetical protein
LAACPLAATSMPQARCAGSGDPTCGRFQDRLNHPIQPMHPTRPNPPRPLAHSNRPNGVSQVSLGQRPSSPSGPGEPALKGRPNGERDRKGCIPKCSVFPSTAWLAQRWERGHPRPPLHAPALGDRFAARIPLPCHRQLWDARSPDVMAPSPSTTHLPSTLSEALSGSAALSGLAGLLDGPKTQRVALGSHRAAPLGLSGRSPCAKMRPRAPTWRIPQSM